MSFAAWMRAARLPSQVNIAPYLMLGAAWAAERRGHNLVGGYELVQLLGFGLFLQLTIVFANDVADVETDVLNRTATPFSGGSRVLVERQLGRGQLAAAAFCAAVGSLGVSAWFGWIPLVLGLAALLLLWLYSFRPLQLSYRGGGELLQMLGIGLLLPLYGWAVGVGDLQGFPWGMLSIVLPMQFANAVATALPDEPSDRESRKRTLPVVVGSEAAAVWIATAQALAFVSCAMTFWPKQAFWMLALPVTAAALQLVLRRARPGSTAMLARVFVVMLATLALTAGLLAVGMPG